MKPSRVRCVALGAFIAACGAVIASSSIPVQVDPQRVFEAAGRSVVIDASKRTITFDAAALHEARGVVGACVSGGRLLVAQNDGVVLVYELPAPETDGVPTLVQRIEHLGRDVRSIVDAPLAQRAIVLASGSTEVFGVRFYDQELIDLGEVDEPAYVDHARFFEFVRDERGNTPALLDLAVGPQVLVLVTERELIELFHLDRSYRVLRRSPWPEGVGRIESLAYADGCWVLSGLDAAAEPVLKTSTEIQGPWTDLGLSVVDAALAVDGEPIAWLPGELTTSGAEFHLAIRGEKAAVVNWPASSKTLSADSLGVRWLGEAGAR